MRPNSAGKHVFCCAIVVVLFSGGCGPNVSGSGNNHVGDPCDLENPCPDPYFCNAEGVCELPPGDGGTGDGGDDGDGGPGDGGPSDGGGDGGACDPGQEECGTDCCDSGWICFEDQCILDQGTCDLDDQCQNDSYCHEGICIPYGTGPRGNHNPDCTRLSIAGLFQPSIQCEWTGPPGGDPYPGHYRVLSTPMVMDFDFDNDPNTVNPSIVVMTYNADDGDSGYASGAGGPHGVIRVLDGETCTLQYNVPPTAAAAGVELNGCNPPALGDLNGDGRAEIVVHTGRGRLAAYTYNQGNNAWELLWYGHNSANQPIDWGDRSPGWAAPALHDLDDDGLPEILSGGLVYDSQGLLLDSSLGISGNMYSGAGYPVAADLDGDGLIELATGSGVYQWTGGQWSAEWSGGAYQGYVAVGDFGTYGANAADDDRLTLDGIAEIGIIRSGTALIMNISGRVVFGPVSLPGSAGGGPPTVGDFDGDGLPELAAAGNNSYTVFDPDCLGLPDLNRCNTLRSDGILWSKDSQDFSSNRTGSSLFDFEGDGKVEAIYADEVFARVYDGRTGEVIFSTWTSSCTWNENPIVADVDGDFNAELLVPSNQNCTILPYATKVWSDWPAISFYETSHRGNPMDPLFRGLRCKDAADCVSGVCDAGYCRCTDDAECGGAGSGFVCDPPPASPMSPTPGSGNTCRAEWLGDKNGVRVYRDVLDRWVGSRIVWNQHTYSVTNINEDGTVPATSAWVPNWLQPGLNNFRQNVQGAANINSSPDLTGGQGVTASCETNGALLRVRVCNRGTDPVALGVPVTFYDGDPSAGQVICTVDTTVDLFPGQCTEVECLWTDPPSPQDPRDVTVVVDDDGTGSGENSECLEGNNEAVIPDVGCEVVR